MTSALNGTDPVVFFESQRIYDKGELFEKNGVPEGHFEWEWGKTHTIQEGKDITIAFNVRYITDVLKALSDDEIVMRFNSNVSPCVICPTQGERYLYLVLPVRVFNA